MTTSDQSCTFIHYSLWIKLKCAIGSSHACTDPEMLKYKIPESYILRKFRSCLHTFFYICRPLHHIAKSVCKYRIYLEWSIPAFRGFCKSCFHLVKLVDAVETLVLLVLASLSAVASTLYQGCVSGMFSSDPVLSFRIRIQPIEKQIFKNTKKCFFNNVYYCKSLLNF